MVYGTVKQSGGFVWVYSEPGLGATFKIYLPRSRQPAALRTSGTQVTPVVGGHETVLLVEDEAAVRTLATRALEGEGYTVLAASDGFEALRLLDTHQGALDLLLTDIVMPGMGGKDVAGLVLARHPRTPVIYMSGYTADDLVTRGLREAGTAFVQKPFLPDHLLRLVRQALDERIDA
jgi:two-component system cell cycle sensor histidine kinase/response regulator CckA